MLLGLLVGCGFPGGSINLPFLGPQASASPSASAMPGVNPGGTVAPAAPSPVPTDTPMPIPAAVTPASLNSPTPTATPELDVTNMLLRIAVPGPMSIVVSPIDFVVYISPDFTGSTRIQLLGEDGRELYNKSFRTFSNIDNATTRVEEKVKFEIHALAEIGRLQISTVDQFGRMQAFNSVRLLLLSMGDQQVTPPYPSTERVVLRTPRMSDEVSGGILAVQGEIQPINDTPVLMELYDAQGNVMGARILALLPADGKYQEFNTTVLYKTSQQQVPARLMIRQVDDRINGLAYLYSVALQVSP